MITKIRKMKNEKTDNNQFFSIPEYIKEKIGNRGFFLYNWIGEEDVKDSIQKQFLELLIKYGNIFAILLIFPTLILMWIKSPIVYPFFFGFLGIINFIIIIYLIYLSIKKSKTLRQNSHILITDSAISINGKIENLKDGRVKIDSKSQKLGKIYEEDLFRKSNIKKVKSGLGKKLIEKLFDGFKNIFLNSRGGKDKSGISLLLAILYSIYTFSLGMIYFIGIFFVWIFGIFLTIINKNILKILGHEITSINNHFEKIDENSNDLIKEKKKLIKLLKNAQNNEWKDSLLIKINKNLLKVNEFASNSIDTNISLKKEIKNSKYKKMFNFSIYNSWIKNQIYTPLKEIIKLLEVNLEKLETQKKDILIQMKNTKDDSYLGVLEVNKRRILMRTNDIKQSIKKMKIYISNLK